VERLHFRPEAELQPLVERAVAEHGARVRELVRWAEVEHVGATSVPGAWTKGDVDLAVRVAEADFSAAVAALDGAYERAQPQNWTATFASFAGSSIDGLPVGVQLFAAGSESEAVFLPLRDRLRSDPTLLEEYNRLKREHEGLDRETYWQAKDRFLARLLG